MFRQWHFFGLGNLVGLCGIWGGDSKRVWWCWDLVLGESPALAFLGSSRLVAGPDGTEYHEKWTVHQNTQHCLHPWTVFEFPPRISLSVHPSRLEWGQIFPIEMGQRQSWLWRWSELHLDCLRPGEQKPRLDRFPWTSSLSWLQSW